MLVFAFTNQDRIARGQATEEEFRALGLDVAYVCPHRDDEGCPCRKPASGMLHQAAFEHGLDLTRCAVIGDVGGTDMLAAAAVGVRKVLVRTGWGESSLDPYRHTWAGVGPDSIAADLLHAVHWLIGQTAQQREAQPRAR